MHYVEQIGRYRLERRLGSGAFGTVWLAHDDELEAPVAVKVLAENWAHRMDIREPLPLRGPAAAQGRFEPRGAGLRHR
ncbi:hypothetical protein ACRAWF_33430 [Streptomyces sp. L7]